MVFEEYGGRPSLRRKDICQRLSKRILTALCNIGIANRSAIPIYIHYRFELSGRVVVNFVIFIAEPTSRLRLLPAVAHPRP